MADIVQLPQQPVFNVPRSFLDKVYNCTLINGQVYFSTEQSCDLLEITVDNWHQRMGRRNAAGSDLTYLEVRSAFNTTYSIPVFYQSQPGSSRAGVTNITQFHHPRKVLEEATSIRNAEKRNRLVNWLIDIGNEVIQQGFATYLSSVSNSV